MAIQRIVAFTKPEAWKKAGLVDPGSAHVQEFRRLNPWFDGKMTSMRYFLRVMGESNGFSVKGMRKDRLDAETFARHYQHVWKYPGAIDGRGSGWAVDMVNLYSSMPLWFFLLEGEHDAASQLRGPTDGAAARDLNSPKFSPYSIRGFFGANKLAPQFHMTDITPYEKTGEGTLSAPKAGMIETVRFFQAGEIYERFDSWPLSPVAGGEVAKPSLDIMAISESGVPGKFLPGKDSIMRLMADFDATKEEIAAFFGKEMAGKLLGWKGINAPKIVFPG